MANKSLVTGGCGFVGWNLVDALVARGDEVTVVDVAPKAHRDDVRYIQASITDLDAVRAAVEGMDTVFHNASLVHTKWNQVEAVWSVNLGGSQKILQACQEKGVKKLVYVSSGSVVYDGVDVIDGDESMPYPKNSQAPYADSKIAAEKEILAANGKQGVKTCSVRPHVIFGPGDNRFFPSILDKYYHGNIRVGVGREKKLSDFTYVSNLIDALLLADEGLNEGGKAAGQAYFITNGEPMGFFDFVNLVLDRIGRPQVKFMVPGQVAYAVAAVYEAFDTLKGGTLNAENGFSRFAVRYLCTHHYFSIDKARRELGYQPKVSVREGIDRTVSWLEKTGQVKVKAA